MLFLAAMHTNNLFKALFEVHIYLVTQLFVHVVATLELLWNYEFIITKIYFHRPFHKNLYYENLEPYSS